MKLLRVWLFLLLPLSSVTVAAPLLQVVATSPNKPTNSYRYSCTLDGKGQIIRENTLNLSPSGPSLQAKEVRVAAFNVADIKTVIAEAALGQIVTREKVTDIPPFDSGFSQKYFAYQGQDGHRKRILLLNKVDGGLFNDSPAAKPLLKFIDSVCGDVSATVDKSYSARAQFSEVIPAIAGIKAAIEVCAQTYGGFGTAGSAGACDGTPSGDATVFNALDQVTKQIAVTPPAVAKIAAVSIALFDARHIAITATAVTSGGLNGETYILDGTYANGFVTWVKDRHSTCTAASLC